MVRGDAFWGGGLESFEGFLEFREATGEKGTWGENETRRLVGEEIF